MATREERVEKMKVPLDEGNEGIDRLGAMLAEAGEETNIRLQLRTASARESRDRVVSWLGELKHAGEASFASARDEIEHMWKTLKQSVNSFKPQL